MAMLLTTGDFALKLPYNGVYGLNRAVGLREVEAVGPLEVDSPVKLLNNLSTMWSGNVSTGSGAEKLSVMVTRFRGFCKER